MRYVFIVNPVAGKGNGRDWIVPMIEDYFSARLGNYKIYVTERPGQAEEISAAEARAGAPVWIFACGGEGTVYEVLNGMVGAEDVSLGVIPCGSANDFLKFFGAKEPFAKIDDQLEGAPVRLDLIRVGDRYCLNQCSAGMDAMVADDMRLFKNWPLISGKMTYYLSIARTFFRKLGVQIRISLDDVFVAEKRCLFATCANAPFYGGNFCSAPDANPADGKLESLIVAQMSRARAIPFLGKYSHGAHLSHPACTYRSCHSMEIEADAPIPINLDGEIIHSKRVRFEIIPGAVSFVLPKSLQSNINNLKTFEKALDF